MTEQQHKAQTILECGECGHQWVENVVLPMRAEAFIARMKGWSVCPNCANGDKKRSKKSIFLLTGERYRVAALKLLGHRQRNPFEIADAGAGVGDHDGLQRP